MPLLIFVVIGAILYALLILALTVIRFLTMVAQLLIWLFIKVPFRFLSRLV
jgi:hypothetical protein